MEMLHFYSQRNRTLRDFVSKEFVVLPWNASLMQLMYTLQPVGYDLTVPTVLCIRR